MTEGMPDEPAIAWFAAGQAHDFSRQIPQGGNWCRILAADLRDPRALELLRPAPLAHDYEDETRKAAGDRAYFLARRAALRSLIGAIARCGGDEVRIRYDADGAPRVEHPAGFFVSVSSHGPIALLVVANRAVGVDFEPADAATAPVPDVLHLRERERLQAMPQVEANAEFLRIWTAKEAYLKACGRGFLEDPALLHMDFEGDAIIVRTAGPSASMPRPSASAINECDMGGRRYVCACVLL